MFDHANWCLHDQKLIETTQLQFHFSINLPEIWLALCEIYARIYDFVNPNTADTAAFGSFWVESNHEKTLIALPLSSTISTGVVYLLRYSEGVLRSWEFKMNSIRSEWIKYRMLFS